MYLEYLGEEQNDLLANNHTPLFVAINQAEPTDVYDIDEEANLVDFSRAILDRSYPILASPGIIYNYIERGYNIPNEIWALYEDSDTQLILMIPRNFTDKDFKTKTLKPLIFNPKLSAYLKDKQEHAPTVSEKDFAVALVTRQDPSSQDLTNWNIRLNGHGEKGAKIAGLSQNSLHDVLKFFNNNVNTSNMALSSCYAGGENLNFIEFETDFNNTELKTTLNYILFVQSISDTVVPVSSNDLYGYFFYAARLKKSKGKDLDKLAEFLGQTGKDSIHSIHGSLLLTQVRFPGVNGFYTFDINNNVKVIGDVFLRIQEEERQGEKKQALIKQLAAIKANHELKTAKYSTHFNQTPKPVAESTPITVDNAFVTLIYPSVIPIPLIVYPYEKTTPDFRFLEQRKTQWKNVLTALELFLNLGGNVKFKDPNIASKYPLSERVSLLQIQPWESYIFPEFISMIRGNAKHLIHRIEVKQKKFQYAGVLNFIRDAFLDTSGRISEKIFLIDELHGYNDIPVIFELMKLLQAGLDTNWKSIKLSQINTTKTDFEKEFEDKNEITIQNVIISTNNTLASISFSFNGKAWEFSFSSQVIEPTPWNFKPKNATKHQEQYIGLITEIQKQAAAKQEKVIESVGKEAGPSAKKTPAAYTPPVIEEGPVTIVITDAINNLLREQNPQNFKQHLRALAIDIEKKPSITAAIENFCKIIITKSSPQKLQALEFALIDLSIEKTTQQQIFLMMGKKIHDSQKALIPKAH